MVKKIVTSVRIDPEDKRRADELHIKYSEAFEKGLKWMLAIKEKDNAKKKVLLEQENKVKSLKDKIELEATIFKSLNEIKAEYNEIVTLREKIKNNTHMNEFVKEYMDEINNTLMNELVSDYMDEVIKLKAMEINVPSKTLKKMFNEFLLD